MIELIRKRRSRRVYRDLPIPADSLNLLEEALLRSPTSRNREPWKYWLVTDRKLLVTLAGSKKAGSKMLATASAAVVIGANSDESDVWIEDCSIAATLLQMTAESLGIGNCWVQIRLRESSNAGVSAEEYVKAALGESSSSLKIASIIALGFSDEQKEPVPAEKLKRESLTRI